MHACMHDACRCAACMHVHRCSPFFSSSTTLVRKTSSDVIFLSFFLRKHNRWDADALLLSNMRTQFIIFFEPGSFTWHWAPICQNQTQMHSCVLISSCASNTGTSTTRSLGGAHLSLCLELCELVRHEFRQLSWCPVLIRVACRCKLVFPAEQDRHTHVSQIKEGHRRGASWI